MIRAALDRLTVAQTCYPSFASLVEATRGGYAPSIRHASLACALRAAGGRCWTNSGRIG